MKKPIKVLFDAQSLIGEKTGVGYYTAQLITALAEKYPERIRLVGYYHNFLLRKKVKDLPTAPNTHYRQIFWIPGQLVNAFRRLGISLPVELLTLGRADIILYPNFWGPPSLFGGKIIPVIHDLTFVDYPEYGADKNMADLQRFVPETVRRASLVISVSNFSRSRIIQAFGTPENKILVTHIPPTPTKRLSRARAQRILIENGLKKPFLLFVGTLEPRKNIGELLDAFAALPAKVRSSYSLVIVGKKDWKFADTIQKINDQQKNGYDIKYLGYVDDITKEALLQEARLLVLPSFYEGFGMPILEAMRYGTACVVSNIPVFHEVANNQATFYHLGSSKDLSNKIQSALQQANDAKNRNARKLYVSSNFSWQKISTDIYNRLEELS